MKVSDDSRALTSASEMGAQNTFCRVRSAWSEDGWEYRLKERVGVPFSDDSRTRARESVIVGVKVAISLGAGTGGIDMKHSGDVEEAEMVFQ